MKNNLQMLRAIHRGWALVTVVYCVSLATLIAAPVDRFAGVPLALQPFVDGSEISGAVALIADADRVLHVSAVGKSDLSTGRAMRTDDLFWIASMTKPITAVCVAMLAEEGRLKYTDLVEKYLPEFREQWLAEEKTPTRRVLVKSPRPLTLLDLLTHTSGMGNYAVTDPHWTLAQMSLAAAREPLGFAPGSRWGYSTAAVDALGRIVEVVSGMPFAEFMQKRLLDPLEMRETTFWPTPAQEKRLARSYKRTPEGRLEQVGISYLYRGAVTDRQRPPLGGAGLFSTAEDIARFYQMMLRQGEFKGRRILKSETVAQLTRRQKEAIPLLRGNATGLQFGIVIDPAKMAQNAHFNPGTFGHGSAHGAISWADPVRGIIYIYMIQRAGLPENSEFRLAFHNVVASALKQ